MDSQQTDFRAHNVPLKLPMPEPGELEERFAIVLVSARRLSGAGTRGPRPGGAADPRPSPSSLAGSEPPFPRGRLAPSPLWRPPALGTSLQLRALCLSGSWDGMGMRAQGGLPRQPRTHCLAGEAPLGACAREVR
ncbi:hypothetical protein P7K49_014099, partial [Saguinus oedipus]